MNYIEHQIANIDTKTQRLQKIAALHSDEQEIIDDIKERIEGLDNCYDEDY